MNYIMLHTLLLVWTTPGISSINWYHLQIARESNYISQEDTQKFWQDIISCMEKLKSTFKNADSTAILRNSYNNVKALDDDTLPCCNDCGRAMRNRIDCFCDLRKEEPVKTPTITEIMAQSYVGRLELVLLFETQKSV